MYSLRHTCIMFRLRDGDKIDLLTIARNARTSVAMIDRFYASQLTGEMNIDSIQSVRREKNKIALSSGPNIPIKVTSGVMSVDTISK